MKKLIISSVNHNLNNAIALLDAIDSETYKDASVGPYYSSIGSHIRHTLDFFDCIINGLDANNIDLTARKRDEVLSTDKEAAKEHIYKLQETLISYVDVNTDYLIHVTDNLGQGKVTVSYTLESILAHANSHAVHHYATIGYILDRLRVAIEIAGFGYNPTTPVNKREGI
ncbi:DinB family protein [Aquimarina sp. 2201CG5-10]|uniref:DinB family protein n=1 Tax=Aquimarina callyspongiae TaxID=3098150 RepID=UPI002AB426ED|nr:DinB family protein [Aquimarina sp. 2201CG5-10]MDY8138312.1 DinB family protein [Aquimarina sp. 2201CG5-10]